MLNFQNIFDNKKSFYYIVLISLITVLFTQPFLRYPYDMHYHLLHIDRFYESTVIPDGRFIWHFLWAKFFYIFNISNSEIFFRAKIIHVIQTYIAIFSIYYFSKVVIRNTFKKIEELVLKYLSFWSVIIWLTIFATFSMHYQLVWTLWYSVNYQITLPLFWYITALTLVLLLEETSLKEFFFIITQILIVSRFILQAHSMEYMYYLMYIIIFVIIYIDKVFLFAKKYFYFAIPIVVTIVFFAKKYQPEKSEIFQYLNLEKISILYDLIMKEGAVLIGGFNRANASINELMYVILFFGIMTIFIIIKKRYENQLDFIDIRNFIFILLTSLFVLIPVSQFFGGLFGVIARTNVVNRLYYSSSIFVLLPIFVYILFVLLDKYKVSILKINLLLFLILSSTVIYSKYNIGGSQNYYKNLKSVYDSFFKRRVGFNLDQNQIKLIGKKIQEYEIQNTTGLSEYYYARADIAFVIKYIYRKNVYFIDRSDNPDYIKLFNQNTNKEFHLILFEIPKGFPDYEPYK